MVADVPDALRYVDYESHEGQLHRNKSVRLEEIFIEATCVTFI